LPRVAAIVPAPSAWKERDGVREQPHSHQHDLAGGAGRVGLPTALACKYPSTDGKVTMDYDTAKVDEVVLALLRLNAHTDHGITRAWKALDWDAMDRLHAQGFISDPKSKAKSVVFTEAGGRKAEELFRRYFAKTV